RTPFMRFSFVVPFHSNLSCLAQCLASLDPLPPESEVIVVADGATEDCRPLAARHHARVVAINGPQGPAVARNAAAAVAATDIFDRRIPWTQLILRYGTLRDDMNLRIEHRLSIVLAYLTLASLAFARLDRQLLANLPLLVLGLTLLTQRYYRFFYRKRG